MNAQRLQLTWYNKDKALIPTETGKYGYTWVDPSDPRYCETHTLIMDDYVRGTQTPKTDEFTYSERADLEPQEDNLLILGESGDVLEALTRVPELAEKYVGQVKLIYIDPPFNTAQTFTSYEDNLEHSIWLTMMRDRLMHMKKLLRDDGSIWVTSTMPKSTGCVSCSTRFSEIPTSSRKSHGKKLPVEIIAQLCQRRATSYSFTQYQESNLNR